MKKILVVDNHPLVLRLLRNQFEQLGHDVRTAADGLAALDILKHFVPDIIFVDLVMPKIGGEKLCRLIRRMDHLKNAYLVILSAIAAEEKIDVHSFGADACIAKGSFAKIAAHVDQVLAESDKPQGDRELPVLGLEDMHQRRITKELLTSRRHYEVILNNMSEGIIEFTPSRQIIFVNPAAAAIIGHREEEVLAADFLDLFSASLGARLRETLAQVDAVPLSLPDDQPLELAGRQVSVIFYPVSAAGTSSIIALFRDITEWRHAEEVARQQHDFLERIFESIQHPYFVIDVADYTIIHANSAAMRELGIRPGVSTCHEVTRHHFTDCSNLADYCPVAKVREVKGVVTVEHEHHDSQGQAVVHEVHAYPVFNADGEVIQVIQYVLDITERHRAEDALRHSTGELQIALEELKKAQAVMIRQEKLASIGTLASGVAHEILNPLNIISTIIQLLQMEELPAQAREQLDEVMGQIRRATKITNNLRMFSHQKEAEISTVQVNSLIDRTLVLVEHDLNLDNILVERDYDPELPEIEADDDQLAQIFLNLISNARDAMAGRRDRRITIRTQRAEDGVTISFVDTGGGIPQPYLDKIFDPFFTTKNPGHGTGLGLSIVYSIVESHNGTIEVLSEEGRGTEFVIHLPAANRAEKKTAAIP